MESTHDIHNNNMASQQSATTVTKRVLTTQGSGRVSKRTRRERSSVRSKVPKGLTPKVYNFKRGIAADIDLRDQTGISGLTLTSDGGVVWAVQAQLSDLPDHIEFTSLFDQYRITGLKLDFYPSRTQALGSIETNLLLRTSKLPTGVPLGSASTQTEWLQRQATTTQIMPTGDNKPISCYMKVNQLAKMFSGIASATEDYAVTSPRFISTSEPSTPHYGFQFRFDNTTADTMNALPNTYMSKWHVELTYYIQCRTVT